MLLASDVGAGLRETVDGAHHTRQRGADKRRSPGPGSGKGDARRHQADEGRGALTRRRNRGVTGSTKFSASTGADRDTHEVVCSQRSDRTESLRRSWVRATTTLGYDPERHEVVRDAEALQRHLPAKMYAALPRPEQRARSEAAPVPGSRMATA